jgi:hypothetical protein
LTDQGALVLRHEFAQFASALVDPLAPLPRNITAHSGVVLAERFAVYRNNVFASLIDALAERFAVTLAVVGEEFFRAMAHTFVQQSRPTSAVLHEYGDDFPRFIAAFPPAASLPWLEDLARLEVLWSQSWGAAEAPALSLESLNALSPEELLSACMVLHPSVRILRSMAPIASLWQAHQAADPDLSTIQWRAEDVLITRPLAQVQLTQLAPGVAAFAHGLATGDTVEVAAEAALSTHPDFEIGPALAGIINSGFAMELRPSCA